MRIVELRLSGHDGPALELHPQITVVQGVASVAARQVVQALEAVCRAQVPEIPTMIAAHGLLVDATPPILDVLQLNPEAVPVITSLTDDDDSGEDAHREPDTSAQDDREWLEAARIARDQSSDALAAAEQQLADAEAGAARVRAELEAAEGADGEPSEHDPSAARAALDDAVARRAAAEADLEAAPVPDLAAAESREQQARAHHDELVARVDAIRSGESSTATLRAELERREAELDVELARLPHGDVAPVREALDAYVELGGGEPAPADDEAEPPELVEAREALDAARRDLAEAERLARPPEFDPADIAALEEAHRESEEAEERASRTMALPAARRRLKRAKEAEQAVLDRMGLPSYGAYLMRTSMVSVDPASQHAVQQAKVRLRDAVAHVDEVAERVAHESARRELAAEDRHRERRADWEAAGARLVAALEHAGATVDEHDLAGSARSWLVQVAEAHERRGELVSERDRVVAQLAQLAELDDAGGDAASERALEEAEGELWRAGEELGAARAAVAEAREQLARRESIQAVIDEAGVQEEDARARVVALERAPAGDAPDVDALRGRLADAHRQVDEAQALVDKARVQVEEAAAELRRAEAHARAPAVAPAPVASIGQSEGFGHSAAEEFEVYVLARLAAQRSVGRAGALPIIIDGALDRIPAEQRGPTLELLSRMAPAVQVIVVSDDERIVTWAEEAGIERALVTSHTGPEQASSEHEEP